MKNEQRVAERCPELPVSARSNRYELVVVVDAKYHRRGIDAGSGLKLPQQSARLRLDGVEIAECFAKERTIGITEGVKVSSNGDTWSVSGDGTLNTTSGDTVTLTAGTAAGTATVTVSGGGCSGSASLAFTVITPSGLSFVRVNGLKHTQGWADIGMESMVYMEPATVSFIGLYEQELDAPAAADGVWGCQNGSGHSPYPSPLAVGADVDGVGSPIAVDQEYTGSCGGSMWRPPYPVSTDVYNIPNVYSVGASGAQVQYTVVEQRGNLISTGTLQISKGNATSPALNVTSPTQSY